MNHIEGIIDRLRQNMSTDRFKHTLGVVNTAVELAEQFGVDPKKARLAALLHDCARDYSEGQLLKAANSYGLEVDFIQKELPLMLHGPVGAVLAKEEYNVTDGQILRAIEIHTTGCKEINDLDKVIMTADFIEPGRRYPEAKYVREQIYRQGMDLNRAVLSILEFKIKSVLKCKWLLHPQLVECRNRLLLETAGNRKHF